MRKSSIVFLFFITLCDLLQAQERFSIGFTGGYGINNTFFSGGVYDKSLIVSGSNAGLVFQHMTKKQLGIQIEIKIAEKGMGIQIDTASTTIAGTPLLQYQRSITYFEIPIMSHFELGKKNFKVVINVGPQLGFTTQNWYSQTYNPVDSTYLQTHEKLRHEEMPHNSILVSVALGLGFSYHFPFGIIQAEARANQSISSVMPAGKYNTFYNTNVGAQISYLYTFKHKAEKALPVAE